MSASISTISAALIGDIVQSREIPDQAALFDKVATALQWLEDQVAAIQPPRLMTGDEFQGAYLDLPSALLATTLLPLRLAGVCRLRFGIGWGTILADERRLPAAQSGSAWWRARQAIDEVARIQGGAKGWPASLSTLYRGEDTRTQAFVDAFLICRDQVLNRLDEKDARITLALFRGESQQAVGRELRIGQSTVSARQRAGGPSSLVRAHESLTAMMESR